MTLAALQGAFGDPPRDAARAFRACLRVMARPGTVEQVCGATPPAPLSVAAGTLVLTLCDAETPVFLAGDHDSPAVRDWITFHTNAPLTKDRCTAVFAFGRWQDLEPLGKFPAGTDEYPDRSATLVVELDVLEATGARLTGPGIRHAAYLSLPETDAFLANNARFPCGLDFYFAAGNRIAGLPRSTKVEAP